MCVYTYRYACTYMNTKICLSTYVNINSIYIYLFIDLFICIHPNMFEPVFKYIRKKKKNKYIFYNTKTLSTLYTHCK